MLNPSNNRALPMGIQLFCLDGRTRIQNMEIVIWRPISLPRRNERRRVQYHHTPPAAPAEVKAGARAEPHDGSEAERGGDTAERGRVICAAR